MNMIVENVPLLNRFISIPKEYGDLNCSAFVAGIIEGALDNSGFNADVTAHGRYRCKSIKNSIFDQV